MLILALDGALATCSAGLVEDGRLLASSFDRGGRGAALPELTAALLAEAPHDIDLVAVTVGPGSFTGLRAALALAHGIGLAAGVPVRGVTVGRAMADAAPTGRAFWVAIDSRRGRVFLDRDGSVESVGLDALPAVGPVAVAGDAAIAVASRLAARGGDVRLLDARAPAPEGIARAVMRGEFGPAQPLYVDHPEARPGPAGRPAPA